MVTGIWEYPVKLSDTLRINDQGTVGIKAVGMGNGGVIDIYRERYHH